MEYRIIKSSKGTRYMKGSKFCKKEDVPEDVLQRLLAGDKVDTSKDCPFCGKVGTEEKTVNATTYYLCLDDYNQKTTGELAQTIVKAKA